MPLVAAGVLILLRHAPSGGNAELGDDHGHGVVPPQHAQVGEIGVDGAVLVIKILLPQHVAYGRAGAGTRPADDLLAVPDGLIVHVHAVENVVEIIGIVGVNVVGNELSGQKSVLGGDVLHVHLSAFHEKRGDVFGVEEGIRGGPVGEGHKALLLVAAALVGDDLVPRLRQHGLKGAGILRGGEIGALIRRLIGVLVVGVGDGHVLPLHAQNVADDPAGYVLGVGAGACAPPESDLLVAVEYVHQRAAVPNEGVQKVLVVGIAVGVLHIVVDPYAVDEPERLLSGGLPRGVVLIKSIIEIVVQGDVYPHRVGAHLLHLAKPAQIGGLVNGVVRGPLGGAAHAQIHALDGERLRAAAAIHIDILLVRGHKGRDLLPRVQVDVPPQPVAHGVIGEIEHDESGEHDDELFQKCRPPSCSQWLNFLFLDSWLYWRRMSMCSSIQAPRWAQKSFICATASAWLWGLRSAGEIMSSASV